MSGLDRERIFRDFQTAVNMSADALSEWLASEQSRRVGWKGRDGSALESVGHAAGRHIAVILRRDRQALGDEDYRKMRKAVGFIRRHLAQRPENVVTSRWRYSLMNWGHDPLVVEDVCGTIGNADVPDSLAG